MYRACCIEYAAKSCLLFSECSQGLKCPSETKVTTNKKMIIWQPTAAGTIAKQNCSGGVKNVFVQRLCYSNGTWGEVNMSPCYNKTADVKKCKSDITFSASGTKLRWEETVTGGTALIFCPGSEKHQASRLCNRNATWSQVELFLCECPFNTAFTAVGIFDWPPTNVKKTATLECPYGPQNAKASRKCLANGSWDEVDTHRCIDEPAQSKEINKLVKVRIDLRNIFDNLYKEHNCHLNLNSI